jgi:cellulose synthase/poly-beta-1,6-N-acetylglucosamine synthase-like glycosyltransferase
MNTFLEVLTVLVLLSLTLLVLYEWFLAVSSFFYRFPKVHSMRGTQAQFLVVIPAHNEELGIASTLESLRKLDYPIERYRSRIHSAR